MSDTTLADADNSSTTARDDGTSPSVPEWMILIDKKEYYRNYGKTQTLERNYQRLSDEVSALKNRGDDHEDLVRELKADGIDEEEARKYVKISQKLQKRASLPWRDNPIVDPEREDFLDKHPEAIQFIDEIERVKSLTPSRKYEDIARGFRYIPEKEEKRTFKTSGDQSSAPTSAPVQKNQAQEDAELDTYLDSVLRGGQKRM